MSKKQQTAVIEAPPETETSPLEGARAEVARLWKIERDWSVKLEQKFVDFQELERQSGESVLSASLAGDGDEAMRASAARTVVLKEELNTCARTIHAARRQRKLAIERVFREEAQAFRPLAQEKIDAATVLDREAEPHREALRKMGALPDGRLLQQLTTPDGAQQWTVEYTTRADLLRHEAASLELQARAAEARRVVVNGGIDSRALETRRDASIGSTIDELIAALTADAMQLGPTIPEIREWAQKKLDAELARRAALPSTAIGKTGRIEFEVVYVDSTLDAGRSALLAAEGAEPDFPRWVRR